MDWLRLWHDMPNDPKWRTIARQSKQPIALVQALYIHLLVAASTNVTRGNADVTVEDLASALDVDEDQIQAVLDAMQGRVIDGQSITGWDSRQPKRNDDSKERVRRYREKKAAESDNNDGPDGGGSNENNDSYNASNADVTQRNADVTPRLDKSREEENKDKDTTCASDDAQSSQKPTKKTPAIDYSSWPELPDEQILKDWLKARTKARAVHSQTAINAIGKELHKAVAMGYTVNQCGEEAATRGWRGFKAEWMQNSVAPANRNGVALTGNVTRFPGRQSVDDHNREVARRWAAGGDCYDQE